MCPSDSSIIWPSKSSPTADKKQTSCPNLPSASATFLPTPPLTRFIWPANIRPSSWKNKISLSLVVYVIVVFTRRQSQTTQRLVRDFPAATTRSVFAYPGQTQIQIKLTAGVRQIYSTLKGKNLSHIYSEELSIFFLEGLAKYNICTRRCDR